MIKKLFGILLCIGLILSITGCGNKDEKNIVLYCDEGTLKDDKCEIVSTMEAIPSCEEGYTLESDTCTKVEKTDAKATKSCNSGYKLSGSTCISNTATEKEISYYCNESSTMTQHDNGWWYQALKAEKGVCYLKICQEGKNKGCYETTAEAFSKLVCPSNTKEINGKCYKTTSIKTEYSCSEGKLNGSKCEITKTSEIINNCEDGYTYNNESKLCEQITIVDAKEKAE